MAVHYYANKAAGAETLEQVRARGSDGFLVQADVREVDDVRAMFGKVKDEFGSLDIFVNNARPELPVFFYPPMEITVEQYDSAVDSQAKAFLVSTQEAAALMPDGGRILAVTYTPGSIGGGFQPWVAMGAGKSAMVTLAQYFAVSLAQRGITVNVISPGWTEPSVLNSLPEAAQDLIRNWHAGGWTPMRRLATPADIGKAAALLCSGDAGWITGQVIAVDGGVVVDALGSPAGDSDRVVPDNRIHGGVNMSQRIHKLGAGARVHRSLLQAFRGAESESVASMVGEAVGAAGAEMITPYYNSRWSNDKASGSSSWNTRTWKLPWRTQPAWKRSSCSDIWSARPS